MNPKKAFLHNILGQLPIAYVAAGDVQSPLLVALERFDQGPRMALDDFLHPIFVCQRLQAPTPRPL